MFASVKIPPAQCGADDCRGCQSVQLNAPNRVLMEFRTVWGDQPDMLEMAAYWASDLLDGDWENGETHEYDREELSHARRVLSRLVSVANAEYVEPNLCETCTAQRYPDKVSPNEGVTHCERCGDRLPEA